MNYERMAVNACFTKAGLAAGTTTTLTLGNAVEYEVLGKSFKKAAASNQATPTTDAITGKAFLPVVAGQSSVFTVCLDAAGALKVSQGQVVDSAGLGPLYGPVDNALTPIGSIHVRVNTGGATWTFGSSNLAGPPANTVITFTDWVGGVPPRPQTA